MMYEEIDFSKIIAVSSRHLSRLPYLEQVERISSSIAFLPKNWPLFWGVSNSLAADK